MQPNVYHGLREMALNVSAADLGIDVTLGDPYGVVMDMGYAEANVTLVTFSDGTASLYYSSGGGLLGGGGHEAVRRVAKRLVETAKAFLPHMEAATDFPLPAVGQVQFFILTPSGAYGFQSSSDDLRDGKSQFSKLFYNAHAVITELRLVAE